MICFCVNSGPAFVIGAVGASMLSDKKCGIILFVSQTVTALIIGFLSRFGKKESFQRTDNVHKYVNPSAFTESVASSTEAMLNICAWILLFSSMMPFLSKLEKINSAFGVLVVLSEVTGGCSYAANNFPLFFLAPVLCWSGFAVHMQLLPYLKKIGVSLPDFWLSRIANCALSLPIAFLLFRLFPCEAQVFSPFSEITVKPYSVSVPASVAMLLLGAFTIMDINLARDKKV